MNINNNRVENRTIGNGKAIHGWYDKATLIKVLQTKISKKLLTTDSNNPILVERNLLLHPMV